MKENKGDGDCPNPCKLIGNFVPVEQAKCPVNPADGEVCVQVIQDGPVTKTTANKTCLPYQDQVMEGHARERQVEKKVDADSPAKPQERKPELLAQYREEDLKVKDYKRADESVNPPCYLPQPGDDMPLKEPLKPMGPIGPWATGKVDWSPLAGLTGTRPVVDRYSITRFSTNEWRQHNKNLLNEAFDEFENSYKNDAYVKNTVVQVYGQVDKTQFDSTKRLRERAQLVNKWKQTLERAIKAMVDELSTMEEQRLRVKSVLAVLKIPQAIASECLERRGCRPDTELVRDKPEEELINERALISEITILLNKTLDDIYQQQTENRAARNRMECDWSSKKISYDLETLNLSLNNLSTTTMFHPGAVRCPEGQSSEEYWMHFTEVTLNRGETCRQKSVTLRETINSILLNSARDLRAQADAVEKAFTVRIGCTQECLNRLENELRQCLTNLADTEVRIEKVRRGIQGLDNCMKVAQTRLKNRNTRPDVENCRDQAQLGLIDEVKAIKDAMASSGLSLAEQTKASLIRMREKLERDIMLKRRTIIIDRDRCMLMHSQFPSANALSGT